MQFIFVNYVSAVMNIGALYPEIAALRLDHLFGLLHQPDFPAKSAIHTRDIAREQTTRYFLKFRCDDRCGRNTLPRFLLDLSC